MTLYPKLILDALANVRYPGTGKNLVEAGMVEDNIRIDGNKVSFSLIFEKDKDPFINSVVKAAETAILTYIDKNIDIKGNIGLKFKKITEDKHKSENSGTPLQGVKNIIAVSSGKGGVGKSTIASNLAVALTRQGFKVGLLDADIFGPSIPKMFHIENARPVMVNVDGKDLIEPIEQYGVKILSIGFFVEASQAVLWRGGMASNALKQLLTEANWGNLDYLLIDLPPGTSDIHLTLIQTVNVTGAIVVTTPQQVALADARKGISMFQNEKVDVPIIGLVENMSWFTPAELPDNKYYIFGKDGARQLAKETGTRLIGQIPVVQSVCESGDDGIPAALNAGSLLGQAFGELAKAVAEIIDEIRRMAVS